MSEPIRDLTLDAVLNQLSSGRQRATYGAVGEVIGRIARSVMRGRPKDERHSWIVSSETFLPTDYPAASLDPQLTSRSHVLRSGDDLRRWIEERTR